MCLWRVKTAGSICSISPYSINPDIHHGGTENKEDRREKPEVGDPKSEECKGKKARKSEGEKSRRSEVRGR